MTIEITRNAEVTVKLSAYDMGRHFADMHSEDQAQFFNGVASGAAKFERSACFQWHMMREDMEKLPMALACFKGMAEYAEDAA